MTDVQLKSVEILTTKPVGEIKPTGEIIQTNEIKKKKRVVSSKNKMAFRLFDFQAFDFAEEDNEDMSGSDENSDNSAKKDKKYVKKQPSFRIEMFGLNEKGETCAIFVDNMNPFFFVKVGDHWNNMVLNEFTKQIRRMLKNDENGLLETSLVDYNKLYGFSSGKTSKFVQLVFQNMAVFNRVRNFWYKQVPSTTDPNSGNTERKLHPFVFQNTVLELYESKIPPLLRYFHIQNISPTGWVEIHYTKPIAPEEQLTSCVYEFCCKKEQIFPLQKETPVPFKICSFDIEASSSHGDFPVPIKNYKRLATQMVDLFALRVNNGDIKTKDDPMVTKLFSNAIKKAFKISKNELESIDAVYPKKTPLKETILKNIEELLEKPVELVKLQETEGKQILTISSMFEKIIEESKKLQKNENTNEGDESDGEEDAATAESSAPVQQQYNYKPKKVHFVAERTATIIDVLLDPKYSREAKIQLTNQAFTCIFPALEGDKVTFIGSTFLKYGDTEPYKNHCLVVGSCDNVEGSEIVSVETEYDLLTNWTELIQREDPDIIIGYNIFGFDYEFMFRRSQEIHCERAFLQLGRKKDEICSKHNNGYSREDLSLENTKTRLASGDYDLRYPNITGRLQIDLLFYYRREFNFASYKLDDVAGSLISDKIKKIEYLSENNTTRLYSDNLTGLHVDDYIHIEIVTFTSDYYKEGKKFHVLDIENVGGKKAIIIAGEYPDLDPNTMALKWCVSKDDVTPQDIFRLTNGTAHDRSIVAKYCIQDCNLVQQLMLKTDILTGYIEMARICNVPMRFLVFRGQGIKLTSYVAKMCREKDTLMPDLEHVENDDGYEGAIVLPPKCAMYMDNPVFCNDYSSLYPSIAKAWNLSPNSKVWTIDYDLQGEIVAETGEKNQKTGEYIYDNLPQYQYINTEFDLYQTVQTTTATGKPGKKIKVKTGKRVCRWAQFPNGEEGIIPAIIGNLLKARSDTRKLAESESDPFMANILDKRQLGYKVTANSLYGQMGSSVSTFYEKDVAASITAIGRMMIMYAKTMIEQIYGDSYYTTKKYGEVRTRASYVYGDTDSVFFTFNLEDPVTGEAIRGKKALEITIEIAKESANLCSLYLPPPMKLAYEKTLMSFILLSKKRYVGMLYEEDPNKGKLKFMGLSLKRRDACDYLKDVYGGVLSILMKDPNNIQAAIEFLSKSLEDLIDGNVSMDKLAITRSLKSDYKNPQQIAHNVLAERIGERDPGNKPKPGDRVKYVYFVNNNRNALQGERIETPGYIVANHLKIDYTHYITNQLMKPLQQLFGLALENIYQHFGKTREISMYQKEIAIMDQELGHNVEQFMKQREKYCSARVKELLFQPVLNKIYNTQNGIRTIDKFFLRSSKK